MNAIQILDFITTSIKKINTIDNLYVDHGWLAQKIQSNSVRTPSLLIMPVDESEIVKNKTARVQMRFAVVGVVKSKTPVVDLFELLRECKTYLTFDKYGELQEIAPEIQEVTFEKVKYDIPDSGDPYAFFELPIVVSYIDKRES